MLPVGLKAIESTLGGNASGLLGRGPAAGAATGAPVKTSDLVVAIAYSIVAVASAVGMGTIRDLDRPLTALDAAAMPTGAAHLAASNTDEASGDHRETGLIPP